jgi:hypothetical protein
MLGLGMIGVNPVGAVTFGTKIIVNGDAEAGIAGWTSVGGLTIGQYGAIGFPTTTDPGPVNRGNNFFWGGPRGQTSASQAIDVSANFGVIDAGNALFDLSGFLGGRLSQNDNASLQAIFRDSGAITLGTATIGPVRPADRNNITGLFARSTSGSVPFGTRSILLNISAIGTLFSDDAYADNLSLVLTNNTPITSVPEPSAIPGILIGGAVVFGAVKKRKRKL